MYLIAILGHVTSLMGRISSLVFLTLAKLSSSLSTEEAVVKFLALTPSQEIFYLELLWNDLGKLRGKPM